MKHLLSYARFLIMLSFLDSLTFGKSWSDTIAIFFSLVILLEYVIKVTFLKLVLFFCIGSFQKAQTERNGQSKAAIEYISFTKQTVRKHKGTTTFTPAAEIQF